MTIGALKLSLKRFFSSVERVGMLQKLANQDLRQANLIYEPVIIDGIVKD